MHIVYVMTLQNMGIIGGHALKVAILTGLLNTKAINVSNVMLFIRPLDFLIGIKPSDLMKSNDLKSNASK